MRVSSRLQGVSVIKTFSEATTCNWNKRAACKKENHAFGPGCVAWVSEDMLRRSYVQDIRNSTKHQQRSWTRYGLSIHLGLLRRQATQERYFSQGRKHLESVVVETSVLQISSGGKDRGGGSIALNDLARQSVLLTARNFLHHLACLWPEPDPDTFFGAVAEGRPADQHLADERPQSQLLARHSTIWQGQHQSATQCPTMIRAERQETPASEFLHRNPMHLGPNGLDTLFLILLQLNRCAAWEGRHPRRGEPVQKHASTERLHSCLSRRNWMVRAERRVCVVQERLHIATLIHFSCPDIWPAPSSIAVQNGSKLRTHRDSTWRLARQTRTSHTDILMWVLPTRRWSNRAL